MNHIIDEIYESISLENLTTYRLTNTAKFLAVPKDIEELKKLLNYLKEKNIKHTIIGNGSNLVFTKDYDGALIKLTNFKNLEIDDNTIEVESGYNLTKLSYQVAKHSLSGLEFAAGIPGTIGGAIYMNAGAYGSDISNVLISVKVLDEDLNIKTISKEDLNLEYRSSIFKNNKNLIILSATIKLEPGNKDEIENKISEYKIKRFNSQPLEYPNAGSVFRNPENTSAGKIIEDLGYKGKEVGKVEVSSKHANFIINKNHVKGEYIKEAIELIENDVKIKCNITLIVEQEFIE